MRFDAARICRDLGLEAQAYVLIFVAIMFSGSLYGAMVPYLIVVEIALLVWMGVAMPNKRASSYISRWGVPQIGILLVFCAFLTWQMSTAVAPAITAIYVRRFLLFVVLLAFVPKPDVCVCAIKASKYYAFVVAVSIVAMALMTGERTGGLVGDYQFGGMMMSISCLLFLLDYFYQGGSRGDIVGFCLSLVGLFISGKRMFALLAVVGFVSLYLLSRRQKGSVRAARLLLAGAAVVGAMYLFFQPVRELIVRLGLLSLDEYAATSGRNLLWGVAMDVFRSNSVVGIGFGNLPTYLVQNVRIQGMGVNLAHNIYYGLLAETGIAGFGLIVGLMTISIAQSLRLLRIARRSCDGLLEYIMVFSVAMQIWFILYGLTGNGIYDWHEFFFYVSALAMTVSVGTTTANLARSETELRSETGDES